jgi:membrane protein implicated in regulation of membrane protease activity
MRATRLEVLHERDVPLVVRARFERTFFGLGASAALILLLGGGYLMMEALLDPLGASDMEVLTAGLALALSSFLLVYLVWPRRKRELERDEQLEAAEENRERPVLTVYLYNDAVQRRIAATRDLGERKNLPGPM